ncbi:cytochrome b [Mycetohabitans sp. B5]|uniref:Cytochrome b561 n=1 Tax=Mycetohabitans endofungorum TaxID=417203 RepID=A0A2P5K8G7_9BURK|nr:MULTISPECIES: cytochrome b [Mycetohabitans]MCG1053560.1 cytochrome b [Mycetohabitans sp. B5]PPB82990.1 cytochrome b561 [Mycetohabitans endofungorum]
MPATPATDRYSKPAIFLHWAIFLLVALAYVAIEVRGPKGSDSRAFWNTIHFCSGSLVLALASLRLLWRLWHGVPAEVESTRILVFLARVVHLALYLFIFTQPLLGILMVNAGGNPVSLPIVGLDIRLIGADPVARPLLKAMHKFTGNLFYWVIGLHALAAIGRHVLLRDRTLRRML